MRDDKIQERRAFVVQGAAAAVALASVAMARTASASGQVPTVPPKPALKLDRPATKTLALNKDNLSKLSNRLYASPAERQKFLANPERYATELLGGNVKDAKLGRVKDLISEGFCCGGCGC